MSLFRLSRMVRQRMQAMAFDHDDRTQRGRHLDDCIEHRQRHGQPVARCIEPVAVNHDHLSGVKDAAKL